MSSEAERGRGGGTRCRPVPWGVGVRAEGAGISLVAQIPMLLGAAGYSQSSPMANAYVHSPLGWHPLSCRDEGVQASSRRNYCPASPRVTPLGGHSDPGLWTPAPFVPAGEHWSFQRTPLTSWGLIISWSVCHRPSWGLATLRAVLQPWFPALCPVSVLAGLAALVTSGATLGPLWEAQALDPWGSQAEVKSTHTSVPH